MKGIYASTALLLFALGSLAQARLDTIRVDVQTISLDVEVFDSNGRPITDLGREDFRIYEDGRLQEIRNFSSVDAPYNVVFLFDCSESIRGHWPLIADALDQFATYKRPDDRALVAAFGSKIQVVRDWSSQIHTTFARDENTCVLTRLHEALEWALGELSDVRTRKGIVVLTDGVDSAPLSVAETAYRRTLNALRARGVPVYFIAVGTDRNPSPGIPGRPPIVRERMEALAEASGGRVAFPRNLREVVPMYEQIARELGTSYSLGYSVPEAAPDGKRHRIEVQVPERNVRIRQSRNEYIWN
jgi:VWFA-related protein